MSTQSHNDACRAFKELHQPKNPLILANVYDAVTAKVVANLPTSKAIATASYAVAAAAGVDDDDLTLEDNLRAARIIAKVAKSVGKPLTVDFQDGYGSQLEEAFAAVIDIGAVGVNMEDCNKETSQMIPLEEAVSRIKRALAVAKAKHVPDFVINARVDGLMHGESVEDVINRGKAYLAAGATTAFVIEGQKYQTSLEEKQRMVEAFNGMLNIGYRVGGQGLSIAQLSDLGVARISVGPQLQIAAANAFKQHAESMFA